MSPILRAHSTGFFLLSAACYAFALRYCNAPDCLMHIIDMLINDFRSDHHYRTSRYHRSYHKLDDTQRMRASVSDAIIQLDVWPSQTARARTTLTH